MVSKIVLAKLAQRTFKNLHREHREDTELHRGVKAPLGELGGGWDWQCFGKRQKLN
jgi:hypothetical protein